MRTERLYESCPELDSCEANVLYSEALGEDWIVELDRTVLFPEGGGQLCDRGTVNGFAVSAVYEEQGRVFHRCGAAFALGDAVTVELDRAVRLYHSQQHTGEHMLSHAFWKLFGAKNIGFHSDEDVITIDLDMELDREQCARAERFANEQIWRNVKVDILYRDRDHMEDLDVRKVTDKVDGVLRLVVIEGGDVCTCCGTHVDRAGAVGLIKIVSVMRHRGGTRLEAMCGCRAFEDYASKHELSYRMSCALSCGADSMEERISAMKEELRELNSRLRGVSARLMDYAAAEALTNCREKNGKKGIAVPLEGDAKEAKQLVNRLTDGGAAFAAVFYAEGDRVGYLISAEENAGISCREVANVANGLLNGKGGGSPTFAQGSGKFTPEWKELVAMIFDAAMKMMQ